MSCGDFCGVIGPPVRLQPVSESVSFRISRTAEDLAQTVATLSKRLVSLEQRLGALELQGASLQAQLRAAPAVDPAELACLDAVDQLLADCRSLLAETELPIPGLPIPGLPINEVPMQEVPRNELSIAELPISEQATNGLAQDKPAPIEPGQAAAGSDLDWDGLEDLEDPALDAAA